MSPQEYARLRVVAYGNQSVKDVIKTDDAPERDLWAAPEPDNEIQDPRFSYLEKSKPIRAPPTITQAPVSLAAGRGSIPAVPEPRPATSYNPDFHEWDAVVATEGQKAVEAERRRLQEAALEQQRLERIAAAENEQERDHDVQTEEESAWEGFESDYEGADWLKKKRPERKTPAERNRVKRRKEMERQEKVEKKEKERQKQSKQMGDIISKSRQEAKAKALVRAEVTEEPVEKADDRVLRRRNFGKDPYVDI